MRTTLLGVVVLTAGPATLDIHANGGIDRISSGGFGFGQYVGGAGNDRVDGAQGTGTDTCRADPADPNIPGSVGDLVLNCP
ncbi:hypothetical protein [Actinoplanes sp. L3-i22]|uniref:hypothetical protein n=1 Tax=Actinoplanes sp. L3-i22 TaxID=2836373 RepID=UPI001C796348|nr:hypothetical protein [Actinoplanes sp. L3-i22]BCY10354.1 hypothetical protein L3i22_054420 [Actinoplanes sp. L3-i22]